jgi:hypothetical protein
MAKYKKNGVWRANEFKPRPRAGETMKKFLERKNDALMHDQRDMSDENTSDDELEAPKTLNKKRVNFVA